jgi:aspartyl-tRNA synthetase
MQDVSEHFRGGGFGIFAKILGRPRRRPGLGGAAPGGGNRAFADRNEQAGRRGGAAGPRYIFWREGEEGGAGPIAKNIGPERTSAIREQLGLKIGDAAFFIAGDPGAFYKFAGSARTKVGQELT